MATLLDINKNNSGVNTLYLIPKNIETNVQGILNNYLLPLNKDERTKIIFVSVFVPKKGVLKKDILLEELEVVDEVLDIYDIKNIVACNVNYYKFFLQSKKKPEFERDIGSVKEIIYKNKKYNLTPQINFFVLNFQPMKKALLDKGNSIIELLVKGEYKDTKEDFLKSLKIYLSKNKEQTKKLLDRALTKDILACDIETTGLNWYNDKLLTISFAVSETIGFSIPLDYRYTKDYKENLKLVKDFLIKYKGKLVFHNAMFDIPFLIKNLFMKNLTDIKGRIYGINQIDIEDTLIMSWLSLNNIEKPKLGLKHLAYSKYGDWDRDIEQNKLLNYSFEKVGKYNTIDTMATYFIYNKFKDKLKDEELEDLYNNFYKDFIKQIIKVSMNGLTLDKPKFIDMQKSFDEMYKDLYNKLMSFEEVKEAETILKAKELVKRNSKLKTKQLKIDEIDFEFNPKSAQQVRVLLYDILNCPILDFTKDSKEPSTSKDTIKKLLHHYKEESNEYKIISILQEIGEMKQVKATFIDGLLEKGVEDDEGNFKIYGNFNINGTISGRMSSSRPNLQNLPSNSKYGKLIKEALIGNKGYIIAQADYSALEDRVGANITKDPNKIRIFKEGIDG